ncbi:MAG: GrpB family protein [Chlamydiia bacterium]|nr:GrpB family protein [Chlamydiia bacterium]
MIEIRAYDASWLSLFAAEAALVKKALGANCLEVHHIGSTAVPGLAAKPVIDMIPVVEDITAVTDAPLEKLGYQAKGEYGIWFRRYFTKPGFHVHIFEEGDPEIRRHLNFRDFLRTHDAERDRYAALKKELAETSLDLFTYTLGKERFIAAIDRAAGSNFYRIVEALTQREWEAVVSFGGVKSVDPNDTHAVLYKGSDIVGYAFIRNGRLHFIAAVDTLDEVFLLKAVERKGLHKLL